jgi:hypothetical protein
VISGSLFSTTQVTVSTPTPSGASSYTPNTYSGPFNLGAKIGIAVGGIIVLLILAGCIIVWRGKHKRRAHLRRLAELHRGPAMSDRYHDPRNEESSPQSQSSRVFMAPLSTQNFPWQANGLHNDSPISAVGEPAYFSPYSSQYNSPTSPQVVRDWHGPNSLPGPPPAKNRAGLEEREPEIIEMRILPEDDQGRWEREAAQTGFTAAHVQGAGKPSPSSSPVMHSDITGQAF